MKPTYRPFYKRRGRPRGRVLAQLVLRTGLHARFIDQYSKKQRKRLRRLDQLVKRHHQQLLDLTAAGRVGDEKYKRVHAELEMMMGAGDGMTWFRNFRDVKGDRYFYDMSPRPEIWKDGEKGNQDA